MAYTKHIVNLSCTCTVSLDVDPICQKKAERPLCKFLMRTASEIAYVIDTLLTKN